MKAPLRLHEGWVIALGYCGRRRFVAIYWEAYGGEVWYDDGKTWDLVEMRVYLDYIWQPQVKQWLHVNGIHLGNSEEQVEHWLIVDTLRGELFALPRQDAKVVLLAQRLPRGSDS